MTGGSGARSCSKTSRSPTVASRCWSMSRFTVEPGQTVAIVGETGSGKSTLTKLVNRIYDVDGGRVLIDGVDVRDWKLDSLRSQISTIEQDIVLFSRPVAENIAFSLGQRRARSRQIRRAARDAQADDFITELPERLRDRHRRARRHPLRRSAPAARDRPCAADRSAHPDPRRLDQRDRQRDRGPDPARDPAVSAGPHDAADHAPALARSAGPTRSWSCADGQVDRSVRTTSCSPGATSTGASSRGMTSTRPRSRRRSGRRADGLHHERPRRRELRPHLHRPRT